MKIEMNKWKWLFVILTIVEIIVLIMVWAILPIKSPDKIPLMVLAALTFIVLLAIGLLVKSSKITNLLMILQLIVFAFFLLEIGTFVIIG